MRKILCLSLTAMLILFTGCSGGIEFDEETMEMVQLNEPVEGQDMAIITTNYGVIRVVLYPERSPKAVENFVTLANEGYYDNQTVFGIEPSVYFMAGSPSEDGSDAKTITGKAIKVEWHQDLWPFKGALCAIGGKEGYFDSRYFFAGSVDITEELTTGMKANNYPQMAIDGFVKLGGVPAFAMSYTVLGQTIEGLDVLDKILEVKNMDNELKTPVDKIIIEKIEITTYQDN